MMSIGLIQVILVLCFVKPCASDVCSKNNLSVYQLWYDPGKSEMSSSWIHSDWNPKQYSGTVSDKENSLLFLQGLLSCAFYTS